LPLLNINFRRHYSRDSLFRMLLLAALMLAAVIWKWDLVYSVYFKDQLTQLGWVINGAILVLFLIGVLRIVMTFLSFMREESALLRFIRNLQKWSSGDPTKGVSANTLIGQRYHILKKLHESHTPINQSTLASTMIAAESTRNSLAKFVNNTLILTGVFGTIVSLSIALIGASDTLENTVDTTGMGMVIHGMSTALSTTITAIVCYFYFGYFYLRVTDAQTNLVSGIEQVTVTHLLPKFQVEADNVLYEFSGVIRSSQELVKQMKESQSAFQQTQENIAKLLDNHQNRSDNMDKHMDIIIHHLRLGFRLRDDE
jgi:hypothetical protein